MSRLPYQTVNPEFDETQFDALPIERRVIHIATGKARVVSEAHRYNIVIGADTLTQNVDTGQVYDKTSAVEAPLQTALSLSGATVENLTAVSFWLNGKEIATETTITRIRYQEFDGATYVRLATGDKPDARSSVLGMFHDAPGFTLIEHIDGSYTGALGLPMEVVYKYLNEYL